LEIQIRIINFYDVKRLLLACLPKENLLVVKATGPKGELES
jgi:hypothetical protein